ncbi:hypothetical protein [Lunatimonas lonarensis]|nr:hypothetical protein [Lunatimonas lonarensis]
MQNIKPNTATSLLFFFLFLLFHHVSHGQSFYKEKIPRENYLQAGFGPSFMYADNGGSLARLDFNVRPSLSVSYARSINSHVDLRTTFGYQFYKSREMSYYNSNIIDGWVQREQAVEASSNIIFADVMPTFNLFQQDGHAYRNQINLYGGAGLGILMAINRETMVKNHATYIENKIRSSVYLPVRGGICYKLDLYSDLAFEAGFLVSFSDKIDGLNQYNAFTDILFQGQIVYRRYLSKFRGVN